jgi:hypothetical protein
LVTAPLFDSLLKPKAATSSNAEAGRKSRPILNIERTLTASIAKALTHKKIFPSRGFLLTSTNARRQGITNYTRLNHANHLLPANPTGERGGDTHFVNRQEHQKRRQKSPDSADYSAGHGYFTHNVYLNP